MKYWPDRLKEIPGPRPGAALLSLFFILLVIFMLSTNFVFLAGIRSKSISLPPLRGAEIKRAHKIIVTLSRKENRVPAVSPGTGETTVVSYEYSFNGESAQDAEAIRKRIEEAIHLASSGDVPKDLMLVLMASRDIPYEKLIEFYAISRDCHVPLYLVTDNGGQDAVPRVMQQPQTP